MDLIKGKRIGLLGGTFDPVHFGHLAAAKAVHETLKLDTVTFIPAYQPPHKHCISLSTFSHRSAMLEIALTSWPDFSISYMEARRNGPSYTCDTLADLRKTLSAEVRLFFITGIDAFQEIHTWKKYHTLLHYADFAVIARPPHEVKSLGSYIAIYFADYLFNEAKNAWISQSAGGEIHVVPMQPVAISSTDIRRRINRGEAVDGLLPDRVAAYIEGERLYK